MTPGQPKREIDGYKLHCLKSVQQNKMNKPEILSERSIRRSSLKGILAVEVK